MRFLILKNSVQKSTLKSWSKCTKPYKLSVRATVRNRFSTYHKKVQKGETSVRYTYIYDKCKMKVIFTIKTQYNSNEREKYGFKNRGK